LTDNLPLKKTCLQALLVTVFLLLAWPLRAAGPAGRGECVSMASRILNGPVPYCVLLPPAYDANKLQRFPVLYYLHGLGDNEQMFLRSGGWSMIQDLWDRHDLGDFIIVTPAAGASFYLNSRDGRYRYEDFFLQEFLPFIEGRYRVKAGRVSRGIAGISMGGYGALRLAFRRPDLFSSVAVHSAAIVAELPAVDTGSNARGRLRLFADVFGSPVDRAFWDRNNPLLLARTAMLSGLKIYLDCGSQDDYGFDSGAQALHNFLVSRKVSHEYHLYPGGHNWLYFAEHLPASLEFSSQAFGIATSRSQQSSRVN
jgi:S-formylglutathione hydrolase FrmB